MAHIYAWTGISTHALPALRSMAVEPFPSFWWKSDLPSMRADRADGLVRPHAADPPVMGAVGTLQWALPSSRASRSHHRLAPEAARFPAPTARDRRPLVCHWFWGSVCAPGLLVPAQLEEVHRDGKCTGKVEVPAVTRVPGSVTARAVILRSDTKRGELHPLREVRRLHRPVAAAGDRAAAVRADRHRGLTSDTGLLTVPSCDGGSSPNVTGHRSMIAASHREHCPAEEKVPAEGRN